MTAQAGTQQAGRLGDLLQKLREAVDRESFSHASALTEQLHTALAGQSDRALLAETRQEIDRLQRGLEKSQRARGLKLRSLNEQGTVARRYRSCRDITS